MINICRPQRLMKFFILARSCCTDFADKYAIDQVYTCMIQHGITHCPQCIKCTTYLLQIDNCGSLIQ